MPVRVSAKLDERDLRKVLAAVATLKAPALYRPVRRFLLSAAILVLDNAASEQIIAGGRFKVGTGPRGGKILQSSPPHPSRLTSRSGELRRSLSLERGIDDSGLPKYIDVGSDLVYAPVHELALRGYPKRAFLAPALEEEALGFGELLFAELARELAIQGVPT